MSALDGYEIGGIIAEGGVATVYKGVQRSLNRPVAIKILSRDLRNLSVVVRHFEQESLIIARLMHPNIIRVIDRGITGGLPYFVMEFIDGKDLSVAMHDPKLDIHGRLDIVIQVCKALSYAHRNSVLHRDIKPGNVLIGPDGHVVVTDFGIAKLVMEGDDAGQGGENTWVMGTPGYMSPEQRMGGRRLTPACDIYSLGMILRELLGRQAGSGEIFSALEGVIEKCLEEDPGDRFQSADEVMRELLGLLKGAHIREERKTEILRATTDVKNRYSLLDIVKEDSFGAVYLFENIVTRQLMVLKKVLRSQAGQNESKMLSCLRHPNIARIMGISVKPRMFVIAMEYQAGGSLRDRLVKPFSWEQAAPIARALCEGLAFAHRNRVIHGNLRPSNILFSEEGVPKITDFGLEEHYISGGSKMNWYSAPGEPRSRKGDIFALGVIFHEMLTGERPEWKSGQLVIKRELIRSVPRALIDIVTKMLSHDAARRYESVEEILAALDEITAHRSRTHTGKTGFTRILLPKAAVSGRVAAVFLLAALTVASSWLTWRYSDDVMSVIRGFLELVGLA